MVMYIELKCAAKTLQKRHRTRLHVVPLHTTLDGLIDCIVFKSILQ
jgi:hypothetical protein